MGLCQYVELCFHASSLPHFHTFGMPFLHLFTYLMLFFWFLYWFTVQDYWDLHLPHSRLQNQASLSVGFLQSSRMKRSLCILLTLKTRLPVRKCIQWLYSLDSQQLPAFLTFLCFRLIASKLIYFQHEARSSEHLEWKKKLGIGFFLMERNFRSTLNGVLTAHTEWLPSVWLMGHSVPPLQYI